MFRTMADTPVDFNLIYRQTEQEIQKEDIEVMADEYGVTITDYQEVFLAELQTSGVERDWTDDGKLIEDIMRHMPMENLSVHLSMSSIPGQKWR